MTPEEKAAAKVEKNRQRMCGELNKLDTGRRAIPAMCREVLSLLPEHTLDELVDALHNRLHQYRQLEEGDKVIRVARAIRAASLLIPMCR